MKIVKPELKDLPYIKKILLQWTDKEQTGIYVERILNEIHGLIEYNMRFWVIKEENTVIGVSGIGDPYPKLSQYASTNNPGLVKILYLDNKFRGRGYGKALLEEMINKAKEAGYSELLIGSHSDYKDTAYGFYLKMGFNVVGRNSGEDENDYMEVFGMKFNN